MPVRLLVPGVAALSCLSAAVMAIAAPAGARAAVASAAAIAAASVAVTGIGTARRSGDEADSARALLLTVAAIYAFGALALFLTYARADFVWYHGWQYAAGSAVFAGLHSVWANSANRLSRQSLVLALIEMTAAAGALAWAVAAGKFQTVKNDWAANDVFAAGGVSVVIVLALFSWRLRRYR